jgi:ferredoxin-type protein NapH
VLPSETLATPVTALKRNRLLRIGTFFIGLVLFYAPFALFVRLLGAVFPATTVANSVPDVHQVCLRMPITWIVQPWLWPTMIGNPAYLFAILVLPVAAIIAGPLFCGWLCPAGGITEHAGRIVPDRWKYDLHGPVPLAPLRYGFFAGMLLAPFVTSNICCSFCNFTPMQYFVSAGAGDFRGFMYWSSTFMVTMVVWLIPLGLFTKGGRGWCTLLCPAGALSNLASAVTGKLPFAVRVRHHDSACKGCGKCEDICPPRAVTVHKPESGGSRVAGAVACEGAGADAAGPGDHAPVGRRVVVSPHLCNACLDCVKACPSSAMTYGRPQ